MKQSFQLRDDRLAGMPHAYKVPLDRQPMVNPFTQNIMPEMRLEYYWALDIEVVVHWIQGMHRFQYIINSKSLDGERTRELMRGLLPDDVICFTKAFEMAEELFNENHRLWLT